MHSICLAIERTHRCSAQDAFARQQRALPEQINTLSAWRAQNWISCSAVYPTFSRFGMQANLIMGGGPHMATMASGPAGSKCSLTISSLMKPLL